jgi:hypothetical protein
MRGMGGIYKRGPVYWIRYNHRGRKHRESSQSAERAVAVALLKHRLVGLRRVVARGPPKSASRSRNWRRTTSRSEPCGARTRKG